MVAGTLPLRIAGRDRLNAALLLALTAGWLAYTRAFAALRGVHAVLPPCPFLLLTGHPCPLCGATRGYSAMWRGDPAAAFRYHPLAPLLFLATAVAAGALLVVAVSGRMPAWRPSPRLELTLFAAGLAIVTAAWAFRLLFLPLPA